MFFQPSPSPSESNIRFKKPTIEEIKEYCCERNNNIDPESFYHFYESKGWKVGKTPMKDWKSCIVTWEKNNKPKDGNKKINKMNQGSRNFPEMGESE